MSHTSSDSSLLQQHRPSSLPPQPHSPTNDLTTAQRTHLETHESRHLTETFVIAGKRSRANSTSQTDLNALYSCASSIYPSSTHQAIASTSSGMGYLNQDPTSSTSSDVAHPEFPCATNEPCTAKLTAVRDGSLGHAIPREQWQPDGSSALCTHPFCSAIFAPSASYFALGPRRHHCRKCGLLFCSSHSNNRALLYDAEHNLVKERVCDLCVHKDSDEVSTYTASRRNSISSSNGQTDSSISQEYIVTPSELSLSRTSSSQLLPQSAMAVHTPGGSLAPVQCWMDKEGVLSLYPLALPSVHRKLAVPAARPLFCPSQAAIRIAKEKQEQAVFTLRHKRVGRSREASSESQQSRRGSMDSVEEEMAEEALARRSVSQERIAQSTF